MAGFGFEDRLDQVEGFLEKRGEFVRVGADLARHLRRARHYALTERVCYFSMDFFSGSFSIFYARHVE